MSLLSLKGKVSIVVGGASGIGEAVVKRFIEQGSNIAIVDINIEKVKELEKKLKNDYKVKLKGYRCDVRDYQEVEKCCNNIIDDFSVVDNMVYSAGFGSRMPLVDMNLEIWEKSIAVNLNGAVYFVKFLVPGMLEKGKGNFIIIGSSTTINGSGGGIQYAASKAGLIGVVKGLSYELLSKGIRTNLITPAVIDTPLLRVGYPDTEEVNKKLASHIPLGRIGLPVDIANIALFLASDESEYIAGQEIVADGGRCLYRHPK